MARALIVGCGCRGRELGAALRGDGWQVRGTTRDEAQLGAIEAAGIEAVIADPARVASIHDQIDGVTLVYWLLGSARGTGEALAALHGARLERLVEKLVDTPVRGLVYESAGSVGPEHRAEGSRLLREASERWRIPVALVDADPGDWRSWRQEMLAAARGLLGFG